MKSISDVIIQELQKMDVEGADLDSSLMGDLELESLQIYELLSELEAVFSVRIPERVLLRVDTVQDLACEIEKIMGAKKK